MRLSVVIPARNEAGNIGPTLRSTAAVLDPGRDEIIVVDDHSTDATGEAVARAAARLPHVQCIANEGPPGFANALMAGFRAARGEYVLPVMADACDDPATIPLMLVKAAEGYDLVAGCRYMPGGGKAGGPRLQGFFSSFVCRSLALLAGLPTRDVSNAFKLYRRSALLEFDLREPGFAFSMEATLGFHFAGYRIADVPTFWSGRTKGASKFKLGKTLPYARLYLRALFRRAPGSRKG